MNTALFFFLIQNVNIFYSETTFIYSAFLYGHNVNYHSPFTTSTGKIHTWNSKATHLNFLGNIFWVLLE